MTMTKAGGSHGRGHGGCGPTIATIPTGIKCYTCQGPHYRCEFPIEHKKKYDNHSQDKHTNHAATSNLQAKHHTTGIESACMIKGIPLSVLIDLGSIDSFISLQTLEKCGLATQV